MKAGKTLNKYRELVIPLLALLVFFSTALFGNNLTPYTVKDKPGKPLQPPSEEYPLGTDPVGRCNLTVLVYGAKISLIVGLSSGIITVFLLGLPLGFFSGYLGERIDGVLMQFTDVFMSIPRLPFIIVVAGLLSPSVFNIILVIGLTSWPSTARIIRSETLRIKQSGFIDASRGFGAGRMHLLLWHFLPSLTPLLFSSLLMVTGRAIMTEAGLAFLGIGDPTSHSWGMSIRLFINRPTSYMTWAWLWRLLPQTLSISGLLLSLASIGNGVEKIMGITKRRNKR